MLTQNSPEWTKESIRSLRLRLGWSRSDLARRMKCSTEEIDLLEEGAKSANTKERGELELILHQAESCSDEVKYAPACEDELNRSALSQIDFTQVKSNLE